MWQILSSLIFMKERTLLVDDDKNIDVNEGV